NPTDTIRIEVENVYVDHVASTYTKFLDNIYAGYESSLIIALLSENILNIFISIAIVCFGILAFAAAFLLKKLPISTERLLLFAGLCFSSGIWGGINFNIQNYLIPTPIFNNSLDILSLLFTMFFLLSYVRTYIQQPLSRKFFYWFERLTLGLVVMTSCLQLTGIADYYEALPFIQPIAFIIAPICVICVIIEAKHGQNSEIHELYWSAIILATGIIADALGNFFAFLPYVIWFKVSYIIFIILQFINLTRVVQQLFVTQGRMQILEELAFRDSLTQLNNRTAYTHQVNELTALKQPAQRWIIWVFDINNLKLVNDTFGHESGDLLIQASATFLARNFLPEMIYRIGGDEFVVLYPIEDEVTHQRQLTQILQNLSTHQGSVIAANIHFGLAVGYAEF
ncbi:MAG: GGDEF domain-containing protein, partial [Culicoidibacterales bacterium]